MNIRKVLYLFLASLPICVGARFFQIIRSIDFDNGFFMNGKEVLGYFMLLVILLPCVMVGVVAFKTCEMPQKALKTNWAMAVLSGGVAVRLFGELFGEVMSFSMPAWQVLVVKLVTVATMIYFLVLLAQKILNFKMEPLLHIIPAIYAITKTVFTFINISALSVISDNILLMASYCVLMLFFINYARIYNGVDRKNAAPKVAAYGFISVILCLSFSLPTIFINAFGKAQYLHSNISVGDALLAIGCYILVFLCEYFYTEEEHIN